MTSQAFAILKITVKKFFAMILIFWVYDVKI